MGEEWLNASKRRKIEETVLQILKSSELEIVTEFGVRSAAALRLGFDISSLDHRLLVRQLVDSFLLSTAAEILRTNSLDRIRDGSWSDRSADYHVEQRQKLLRSDVDAASGAKYVGKIICKLSNKRRVTVHDCAGANVVSIRDFYVQSGNLLPVRGENAGISLPSPQWSTFRKSIPSIEEAIAKLESRLRSEDVTRQSKTDIASSVAESASEQSQTKTGDSNLASAIQLPGKRKRDQSEQDTTSSAADISDKGQTHATISNMVSTIHPHIKSEQTDVDTSNAAIASISQERILSKEARDTYGIAATSNYQEHIPTSRSEAASENSTLVPPLPNQLDRVTPLYPEKLNPSQNDETYIGVPTSVPSFPSQRHSHHTAVAVPLEQLLSIQPARLDGKNYHSWKNQMDMFLNQLGIAYVLFERCPNITFSAEASFEENIRAKTAVQRWIADDHLCRHHILNSLCDSLFQLYSQTSFSAGELWQELKAVYNDDFGTKRSQVNKYIHFQMVDGVSVLDQVQELHEIADSIIASGTWIEESFHTSVIVSKLPPSWKELRLKLMREEFLPLNMLMHRLQVEANKTGTNSKKDHFTQPDLNQRHRTKKDETKRECYTCGMDGHMRSTCPRRKYELNDKSNSREKGFQSPRLGRMDDANNRACFGRGKDGHISKNSRDKKFGPPFEKYAFMSPCTGSEMDDAAKRN